MTALRSAATADIAIVDLGYGNIGSIAIAFERLGATTRCSADPAVLRAAPRVVLPGVGAAGYAMRRIEALGLAPVLRALSQPLLGICLGMQLLFEHCAEDDCAGRGLIAGSVRPLSPAPGRPVPHMGWSRLALAAPDGGTDIGIAEGDYAYFAHSYACDDGPATLARTDYGGAVPAVVARGNIVAAQFHPERSGPVGAAFLAAFLVRGMGAAPC